MYLRSNSFSAASVMFNTVFWIGKVFTILKMVVAVKNNYYAKGWKRKFVYLKYPFN
jgi:hypothetical protein